MMTMLLCAPWSILGAGAADPSTLVGKVVFGYQGWFNYAVDGANVGWRHWSHDDTVCNGTTVNFDLWPDMSEYTETEQTSMHYANGQPATLFSSLRPSTVLKHFQWLQEYNLDGVFLQRFLGELKDPRFFAIRNNVTQNVRAAAEEYNRTFSIMYDISGVNETTLVQDLKTDWNFLVQELKVDQSLAYQRHEGKIVVTIWGLGFTNHPGTPEEAIEIVQFLQQANCFVMGGVPFHWRDSNSDSKPDYLTAYLQFDGLSPWSVGRYSDPKSFGNTFTEFTVEDKNLTYSNGKFFAPVIFPGGSNANEAHNAAGFNSIPRLGGAFFTSQASTIQDRLQRDKSFVYIAMFDEVDEGTAMLKAATRKEDTPVDATFLYLNIDGTNVSNDHYLLLASDLSNEFKKPTSDHLLSNGVNTLRDSTCLRSASNAYRVCMQADRNLVIYTQSNNTVLWALGISSTTQSPYSLIMQANGNTVIYDCQGKVRFAASNTASWATKINNSSGPYQLVMQDDGNVVSYDKNGLVVWAASSSVGSSVLHHYPHSRHSSN